MFSEIGGKIKKISEKNDNDEKTLKIHTIQTIIFLKRKYSENEMEKANFRAMEQVWK